MGNKTNAIIICNYNKKEYVKMNIQALLKQSREDFDIYVVDNASTDGTFEELTTLYGNKIKVIQNATNLGGSGGFNTGLRNVIDKDYKYIMLLDNDVVLKENCIEVLCRDMDNNPSIGIMGAKILKMDEPNTIQEFAPTINYNTLTFELNYGGEKDDISLPHLADCDYVPACALMARAEAIKQIGYMPEENFIYYDDIVWGVMCHRAGYRVVANSYAIAWHKGGARINPTTFGCYYLNRNKTRFFLSYMQTCNTDINEKIYKEERINRILMEMFEGIYSCKQKGAYNVAKTRLDAFEDALYGVTGRAKAYQIREAEIVKEKFDSKLEEINVVTIYMNGLWENTRRVVNHIITMGKDLEKDFVIEIIDEKYAGKVLLGYCIKHVSELHNEDNNLILHMCSHIYELDIKEYDCNWIDGWRNVILDEKDFQMYKNYALIYDMFKMCYEDKVRFCLESFMKDI